MEEKANAATIDVPPARKRRQKSNSARRPDAAATKSLFGGRQRKHSDATCSKRHTLPPWIARVNVPPDIYLSGTSKACCSCSAWVERARGSNSWKSTEQRGASRAPRLNMFSPLKTRIWLDPYTTLQRSGIGHSHEMQSELTHGSDHSESEDCCSNMKETTTTAPRTDLTICHARQRHQIINQTQEYQSAKESISCQQGPSLHVKTHEPKGSDST